MERCIADENELWKGLEVAQGGLRVKAIAVTHGNTLPGQPRVRLDTQGGSDDLWRYIRGEHLTPILDRLARKPDVLWLVSTPDSAHIRPLHQQAARGRGNITVVENPELHLVWKYEIIFIKPIPKYLFSAAFWTYIKDEPDNLGDGQSTCRAAIAGFLRTYGHLIQFERDFWMAQEEPLRLIPKTDDGGVDISFERFVKFIEPFAKIKDAECSPRYSYGELRLTRLNWVVRLRGIALIFWHIDAQWGSYLNRLVAPMLTAFAFFSIILNTMQVELAVQSSPAPDAWVSYSAVSRWCSVVVLFLAAIGLLVLISIVAFFFFHDIWYARSVLAKRRRGTLSPVFKSGAV